MKRENTVLTVAIYLKGAQLQPARITEYLAVQPTEAQMNGSLRAGSSKVVAKTGMWAIEAQADSVNVMDHISELFSKIGNPQKSLDSLDGVEHAYIDIFAAFDDGNEVDRSVEMRLSKDCIKEICRLGLSLQLTISG